MELVQCDFSCILLVRADHEARLASKGREQTQPFNGYDCKGMDTQRGRICGHFFNLPLRLFDFHHLGELIIEVIATNGI